MCPCLGGWIVPLPGRYGWPPARVTGLAPCRLGYGTAGISGTAQGAGSEQKTPFCSESAPFCRFLNKIADFVQIRREMGPLRRQFHEERVQVRERRPSSRPVLREAGSSARKGPSSPPVPRGAGSSSARSGLWFHGGAGSGNCLEPSAGKKEGKFENERIKSYLYDIMKRRRNYE